MASTSASSIKKSFKYDVFLSFRGEDTRKTFVDHLYHALTQKGIITYRDDEEIKKGERISDELIRSIEDSKFYIIVFSKNYASSSWCLEELVEIMECQETNEHTAYPIFYDVEPTEVRKQIGAVEEAFSKHKEKENAEKWREALREAAALAGWELKNTFDGHEAKLIQKIVEEISLELRFINSSVDGKLVGMETRVEDVVKSLEIDIEDVRMIGIWGMGGAGKTTLARAVFDQLSYRFEGSSFVENVRENSKNQFGGLKSLQKQVLSEVLNDPHIIAKGVSDMKMMRGRKVLVVLDDVDHIDQLEALAGDWFKLGSRVIITTRDKQVLVAHGVPKNLILDVKLLSHEEANCLFNKYAFGKVIPNQVYEELSERVALYADGLPLTIKVLGSLLRGKAEPEWIDELERLEKIPSTETLNKLELSYKSLEYDRNEIFLDVACMLKGWRIDEAIIALESCGYYARIGLNVLKEKSLITISFPGCLHMHDRIEEMGKNIVRRVHPNKPYMHSRLWVEEETKEILVEEKGTEETRCIRVRKVDPFIAMKGLRKMKELRFLDVEGYCNDVDYKDIDEDSMYLPNGLQYLSWDGYPFPRLPNNFKANNLVGLKLHNSNIYQLWEGGDKVPKKLRFIKLYYCKLGTLDIGPLENLERLKLVVCENLEELNMGTGKKPKLKHLNLRDTKLKALNLKNTEYLESLHLECEDLVELHMPNEFLKLKSLNLSHSKLRALDIGPARNFHTLNFNWNNDLVELHLPAKNLKHLFLSTNKYLEHDDLLELHMPTESPKLKIIYLCSEMRNPNLTTTKNHERLGFVQCEDFLELHNPIESRELKIIYIRCQMSYLNLKLICNLDSLFLLQCNHLRELHMPVEFPELKIINIRCFELETLNLTGAWNLEKLDLVCMDSLELHMPNVRHKLKTIHIRGSKLRTLNLIEAGNLEMLDLVCKDTLELRMPNVSPKLKTIQIRGSKLRTLNLTGAGNIEMLDLLECQDLLELQLPNVSPKLKTIHIRGSELRTLNLTGAGNLEMLDLLECQDLLELQLPNVSPKLKTINIRGCKLRTLNLNRAGNLEVLDLQECQDLLELHLPNVCPKLKTIHIRGSKLRTLNLTGAGNLEMLDHLECQDLLELHLPVESLKHLRLACSTLKTLNLTGAENLDTCDLLECQDLLELHLPIKSLKHLQFVCSKLGTLKLIGAGNLERFDLIGQDLREVHLPFENLIHLKLTGFKWRTLNLTGARNLEMLDLVECQDFLELLMHIESPKLKFIRVWRSKLSTFNITGARNLEKLDLLECQDLLDLYLPVVDLKHLQLTCSKMSTLKLTGAGNLESLDLVGHDLLELHDLPFENLKHLQLTCSKLRTLYLAGVGNLKTLNIRCSKLEIIKLELSPYLERLVLNGCYNLREVYAPIGYGCVKFKPLMVNRFPMTGSSAELHLIVSPVGMCPLHIDNNSPKFHLECNYKEPLPLLSGNLAKLISFGHCACTNLAGLSGSICGLRSLRKLTLEGSITEVPKELDQLICLEELTLLKTDIEHLPDSICTLKNLKFLQVESCRFLKQLPEALGRLECLEELTLLKTDIEYLPDSICTLKNLKSLQVKSCRFLKQLPEDLGRLECLEELHLEDCESLLNIPNSICEMTRLKCFHLIRCIRVMKLPREIGRLPCLKDTYIEGTGIIDPPESLFQLKGQVLFFP